jgi:APA family basic amino acid/polyamine antiporter
MKNKTPQEASCTIEKLELRRDVTVWGSYMWGYADVGADIYAALGLVMGAAHGGASLAFFVAGLIYIMIGLSYTEMASTYPVAGGGHYYALRGLGDFWGYAAGVALLLDYTIDIALFATASAGYMNFFMPYVLGVPPETEHAKTGAFDGGNHVFNVLPVAVIAPELDAEKRFLHNGHAQN